MPNLKANGIEIEYETFGETSGRPLLLVMGLGRQLIAWDDDFCVALVDRGHFVIRYDNRDVGLSSHFDDAGLPNMGKLMAAAAQGKTMDVPYRLSDMAADGIGLLDGLGIDSAHIVGASLGGMLVQLMAIEHRTRVKTMTSIMSNTGRPGGPPPTPEAMKVLMVPPPETRDGVIEHAVKNQRAIGSPGFPFDEERVRTSAGRGFDRAFHPQGTARQLAAVTAAAPRAEQLKQLALPTLVIHGDADPLVDISGGVDTHECVAGSEFLIIEGMGHDLPRGAWPQIVDGICRLTESHG